MINQQMRSVTTGMVRLASIDAYRGFVMLLMLAEILSLPRVAKDFPDDPIWQKIRYHTTHVEWTGCSLHDLIQPSFSFLVGVAVPFSIASRITAGQSLFRMGLHALWRSLMLVALGIFLRSTHSSQTNFTFEDTLTQIGLGYFFLFLLGLRSFLWQFVALVAVLGGYYAAFVLHPLPGPDFDYTTVGVPANWPHLFEGFQAHWNKNSNLAWSFDTWFLNLFPREKPFLFNGGGYATLSFIPTLGTMILGLMAGSMLKDTALPHAKTLLWLALAAFFSIATGLALEYFQFCPIVKRIWTPSWTLFSGGICFAMLAGFYLFTDAIGYSGWAYPLKMIGANSIFIYCISHLIDGFIIKSFHTHLGKQIFQSAGAVYEPILTGAAVLVVFWLMLDWMYRRQIFIRI